MKQILFGCMLLVSFAAKAQKAIFFYKNDGRKVAVKDSADFIRVIEPPQDGFVNYRLTEYYLNNKLKTVGTVSKYEPQPVFEGVVTRFDRNGVKSQILMYQKGAKKGPSVFYYPNGKVRKEINYDVESGMVEVDNYKEFKYRLVNFYDSTGVKIATDGSGKVRDDSPDFFEEGTYTNGVKTGVWRGKEKVSGFTFEEEYDAAGELLKGTSVKDGTSYPYSKREELPVFVGGDKAWLKFVQKFKYPRTAVENGIKGSVKVGFNIGKDGKLYGFHILKSLTREVDDEAIKLLSGSPDWIPGKMRGLPVDTYYAQTITLNLQSR